MENNSHTTHFIFDFSTFLKKQKKHYCSLLACLFLKHNLIYHAHVVIVHRKICSFLRVTNHITHTDYSRAVLINDHLSHIMSLHSFNMKPGPGAHVAEILGGSAGEELARITLKTQSQTEKFPSHSMDEILPQKNIFLLLMRFTAFSGSTWKSLVFVSEMLFTSNIGAAVTLQQQPAFSLAHLLFPPPFPKSLQRFQSSV